MNCLNDDSCQDDRFCCFVNLVSMIALLRENLRKYNSMVSHLVEWEGKDKSYMTASYWFEYGISVHSIEDMHHCQYQRISRCVQQNHI